jgi:uncharacterized membrane protein
MLPVYAQLLQPKRNSPGLDKLRAMSAVAEPVALQRARLESVDVVRGLIMVIMALDHTRDFFGYPGSPTNLATASIALFFTRWITNICAPVFFLLTGTGAFLSLRKRSKRELSRFLFTRGLWLIFLELVLFRCLILQFNFDYHATVITVLWALGWAMIVLSVLVYLPTSAVTVFGILLIVGHNLFDTVQSASPLWSILHSPNVIFSRPGYMVFLAYPLIPWIGVTAAGYGLGQIYAWPSARRRTFLLRLGLCLTVTFIILRAINVYGDPSRWSTQPTAIYTVLSFLNTTKYPPSLLFLLMTLGPALLLLWAVDEHTPTLLRPALIIGKVPLFYYLLHFFFIHLLAVVVSYIRFSQIQNMFQSPDLANFPVTFPPGWGFTLPLVYLTWAIVVIAVYPLCRWYAALKRRSNNPWLSYI